MELIAVIGAGTMGHGIAQATAQAGYQVRLTDASGDVLEAAIQRVGKTLDGGVARGKLTRQDAKNTLERILPVPSLTEAVDGADLVIEAVVEDLEVKQDVFRQAEAAVRDNTILASNTSSLSLARIAEAVRRPERLLGMHFFNPVHIMKLVEIVVHDRTDDGVVAEVAALVEEMGKRPIRVKDAPGFASSRLGVVLGLEAMRMLEAGIASAEDIDTAMELGYGHAMGPLRVSDLVGLDVRLAVAEYLHRELGDAHYAPPAILRRKVEAGELGKKTGKGFYEWREDAK